MPRPVEHKILRGAGAGKWLPFARSKLARLAEECKRVRAPHRTRRFTVDAGMVDIRVGVKGDQHYIEIRRKTCPPFLSGFCDLVFQTVGGVATPIYQIPNPSPPPETTSTFRRFYSSAATPAEDRGWRDEPGLAVDEDAAKQLFALKGSMFSGEMRKVVQILQGMNVEVPYSPTYGLTHGVWRNTEGRRWIIEVSNTGVAAWPMEMCGNPIHNAAGEEVLDYTPVATPRPTGETLEAARAAGTFVDLLDAGGVREAYTKAAFSAVSGWAFSANGSKASNVCWVSSSPLQAFAYTITITEADGRPASAAMAEVSRGDMAVSRNTCFLRYPAAVGTAFCVSFDPGAGGTGNTDAPVWCWYEGEELVLIRLVWSGGVSVNSLDERVECHPECNNPSHLTGPNDSGAPFQVAGSTISADWPHFTGVNNCSRPQATTFNGATFRTHIADGPIGVASVSQGCFSENTHDLLWHMQRTQTTYTGGEILRNIMIVPAFEREGAYFGARTDRSGMSRTAFSFYDTADPTRMTLGCAPLLAATFTASVAECCATNPTRAIRMALSQNLPDGSSMFCANGTRELGWDQVTVIPGPGAQYINQSSGTIQLDEQDGGLCITPELPPLQRFSNQAGSISAPDSPFSSEASICFVGSGGVFKDFPLNPSPNLALPDLFDFDLTNVAIVANRDAFGANYLLSPDAAKVFGPDLYARAPGYPITEAAAELSWIGVP